MHTAAGTCANWGGEHSAASKIVLEFMLLVVTHDASGTSYTAAVLMACFQYTSLWDTLVARMWQYA